MPAQYFVAIEQELVNECWDMESAFFTMLAIPISFSTWSIIIRLKIFCT